MSAPEAVFQQKLEGTEVLDLFTILEVVTCCRVHLFLIKEALPQLEKVRILIRNLQVNNGE